jgi:hypothetical protein
MVFRTDLNPKNKKCNILTKFVNISKLNVQTVIIKRMWPKALNGRIGSKSTYFEFKSN